MKIIKAIVILLLIMSVLPKITFAVTIHDILTGEQWKQYSKERIMNSKELYKKAFVELYKFSKESDESDVRKLAFAYGSMSTIFRKNKWELYGEYKGNKLESQELINVFQEIESITANPKSARDYFVKGVLIPPDQSETFQYVRDNFPDTPYAEMSYPFSGDSLEYLEKYGEKAVFTIDMYVNLMWRFFFPKTKEEYEFVFKYANKLISEFPEDKKDVANALHVIANYYENYKKDDEKALEAYYKIFNDPEMFIDDGDRATDSIVRIHKNNNTYGAVIDFINELRVRNKKAKEDRALYENMLGKNKSKIIIRKFGVLAMYYQQNIEEIKRFSFDRYDRSDKMTARYKANKIYIDAFDAEFKKCFDKDFNIIKPIESIKIGQESGK